MVEQKAEHLAVRKVNLTADQWVEHLVEQWAVWLACLSAVQMVEEMVAWKVQQWESLWIPSWDDW